MDSILVSVAVITGLTQVIKKLGVSSRYIPLVAVIIGITYGLVFVGFDIQSALAGLIAGLTSVGAYRTVQKAVE